MPAAGRHWSLPLYDPLTRLIGFDRARSALLGQAELRESQRCLDVGCGTGSLVVLIKRVHPNVDVRGLDPDPAALGRARRKAQRAGLPISLDQGFSDALPYDNAYFDRVFSSFMFHHLPASEKLQMLRESRRVLKPGGRLELVDFGGPDGSSASFLMRLLHSDELLRDNVESRVLGLMAEAGFARAARTGDGSCVFGRIAYYQAS